MSFRTKAAAFFAILAGGIALGYAIARISPGSELPSSTIVSVVNSTEPAPDIENRPESVSIKEAAKKVTPTVVYIESSVSLSEIHRGRNPGSPDFWQRFAPGQRVSSSGSGVLISKDGFILTNHHVIAGSEGTVFVELPDRRRLSGTVVGSDPSTDLAVVFVEADGLNAAVLGNSDAVEVGDWVLAVGNPFRLRSTVTAGIVSALGRDVEVINDRLRIEHFIQTDAAINRGNSGGALVNLNGQVIGINTAIASESGSYEGYGFAIPINMALKIAKDIMEFGSVKRGLLGVQISTLDYQRARQLNLPVAGGVEVMSLSTGSSAAKSGISSGDVILEVNGKPVFAANELQAALVMFRPGDVVTLSVWQQGKIKKILVDLMDAGTIASANSFNEPEPVQGEEPSATIDLGMGFRVSEVIDGSGSGLTTVVVVDVTTASEAWKKGLREDDRIIGINGYQISALFEAERTIQELRRGTAVRIECEKPDGSRIFYVLRKP